MSVFKQRGPGGNPGREGFTRIPEPGGSAARMGGRGFAPGKPAKPVTETPRMMAKPPGGTGKAKDKTRLIQESNAAKYAAKRRSTADMNERNETSAREGQRSRADAFEKHNMVRKEYEAKSLIQKRRKQPGSSIPKPRKDKSHLNRSFSPGSGRRY